MAEHKIKFEIDAQGNSKIIDACGFGTGCEQATQDIEKLLGKANEGTRENTDQFNKMPEQDIDIDQGNV